MVVAFPGESTSRPLSSTRGEVAFRGQAAPLCVSVEPKIQKVVLAQCWHDRSGHPRRWGLDLLS